MNIRDNEEDFDYWLDEVYPLVIIGNSWFSPSRVLKHCDEVTYDIWYWNWKNNEEEEEE